MNGNLQVVSQQPSNAAMVIPNIINVQELIRRWDSERELLRSAPGSYSNSLK